MDVRGLRTTFLLVTVIVGSPGGAGGTADRGGTVEVESLDEDGLEVGELETPPPLVYHGGLVRLYSPIGDCFLRCLQPSILTPQP